MIYGSRNHLISGPRFAQSSDRRWSRVLHRQAIDTTTRAGRMFFQVTGAFAEFERSMIRSRVKAGLDRAKARGVRLGRPRTGAKVEAAIRARLAAGEGIKKVAKALDVGNGTVSRIKVAMQG
jgi:DNA invertase Pin-like site-specific DNA recombinase